MPTCSKELTRGDACIAAITEGVTIIENKRPDWLLQYNKHCQKLIKVGG